MSGGAVLVAGVGVAEGSRAAAAALACAASEAESAAVLVDLGGRAPRPTLLASAAAQRLEERLAAHLPGARVAARGTVCHLTPGGDEGENAIEVAAAAAAVGRDSPAVIHCEAAALQELLGAGARLGAGAVLLRADLERDRPLVALLCRDLMARGLRVAVLKRPLGWTASRRALFGALGPGAAGGIPPRLLERLGVREGDGAPPDPGSGFDPGGHGRRPRVFDLA